MNMEQPPTHKSTASTHTTNTGQTTGRGVHDRLPTNDFATVNKSHHPTTPRDPTPTQQHREPHTMTSAQHTEQQIAVQAPTLGMDTVIPHKDGSTQMPSQEMDLTTANQSTQMPSQQWESAPEPKKNRTTITQTRTHIATVPQGTSHNPETYRESHAKALTPLLPETHLTETMSSHTKENLHSISADNPQNRVPTLDHEPNTDITPDGNALDDTGSVNHQNKNLLSTVQPNSEPGQESTQIPTIYNNPQYLAGTTPSTNVDTDDEDRQHSDTENNKTHTPSTQSTVGIYKQKTTPLTNAFKCGNTGRSDPVSITPSQQNDQEVLDYYENTRLPADSPTKDNGQAPAGQSSDTQSTQIPITKTPTKRINTKVRNPETTTIKHPTPRTYHTPAVITITSSENSSEEEIEVMATPSDNPGNKYPQSQNKAKKQSFITTYITLQHTNKISERDPSEQQADETSKDNIPIETPNAIRLSTQTSAETTIIPQGPNNAQQRTNDDPTQQGQTTELERDLNNNSLREVKPNTSAQQREQDMLTNHATTRGTCNGTIYRLTPMGKSNHPVHQEGPCRTHLQDRGLNPTQVDNVPDWEIAQTRDPKGINNFHQDSNGKLTITNSGHPECNYCKLPKHSRQACVFRLKDMQHDIDRRCHPKKGYLTKEDAKEYKPPKKRTISPMSTRLARELDNTGNPRFWQTKDGHIIYSINNQPHCAYCGTPSHGRDRCFTRQNDEDKGIFRIHHPLIGHLNPRQHQPAQPKIIPDYIQTHDGERLVNHRNHPLCYYCGIPSHSRSACKVRERDRANGIERVIHPNRGNIPSGNQIRRTNSELYDTPDEPNRKRSHPEQEDSHRTKTRPSPTYKTNYNIFITMNDGQKPGSSLQSEQQTPTNLMDLPTEMIKAIVSYLPFKDIIKLQRVNKRFFQITNMDSLWKDITISSAPLSCELIHNAINKQATTLNLQGCSIQGNYTTMLSLGHKLRDGLSQLKFLGLQGYKGSDILAAIIIAESTKLDILDISENRYSLVGTVIGKMKTNNKLTAINLSAIGGHYAEMGGLVYHPFDIHKMKPLVDKCRHLTDIILFGSKLTHEAITYFCKHAPPTLLRVNLARERAYNDDIRELTQSCPHLQYLNITETSVAYQDIINIVLAWRRTMINLSLPHRLGFVLTLRSRAPNLPLISQFQTLIQEMERLQYLHVGHYKFHQADIDNRRPQVARLKSMFPNLIINHNPYAICPNTGRKDIPQSDPSFRFARNIGPISWTSRRDAEVVPIFDVN